MFEIKENNESSIEVNIVICFFSFKKTESSVLPMCKENESTRSVIVIGQ